MWLREGELMQPTWRTNLVATSTETCSPGVLETLRNGAGVWRRGHVQDRQLSRMRSNLGHRSVSTRINTFVLRVSKASTFQSRRGVRLRSVTGARHTAEARSDLDIPAELKAYLESN
jgi:hypothetical protein